MDCWCTREPMPCAEYDEIAQLGLDDTKSRYAEVVLWRCKHCGRVWLRYFVEYEHRPKSGRYYMGLVEKRDHMIWLVPEIALPYIASLDWHLYGGSYFNGQKGRSPKGSPIFVDD